MAYIVLIFSLILSCTNQQTHLQAYLEGLEQANTIIVKQYNLGKNYFLEKIRKPYLKKLIDNHKSRFEDKSLISVFDIFDPKRFLRGKWIRMIIILWSQ